MTRSSRLSVLFCLSLLCVSGSPLVAAEDNKFAAERTLIVPVQFLTIQEAIDAAGNGDTVLVSPGVYHEGLRISGKSVRLVSQFVSAGDQQAVQHTILDGATTDDAGRHGVRDQVILIDSDAGPDTEIVGFSIRNGDDGISCHAHARIAHNNFTRNEDAIDYEGGGGLCEHNRFENNGDDAVDYDGDCDATVLHNQIAGNRDDGIEIRLQPYRGKTLQLTIRDNHITGNGEDGIQIIDYPGQSDRHIRIENNLITRNAMAGIGCMSDAVSDEDYRAAAVPEPIEVIGNTIAENEFGLTGGENLVAFNNVIVRNRQLGMKKVAGRSEASHNLFWANGRDFDDASNVRDEHTVQADPGLADDFRPLPGSPCIDAGVTELERTEKPIEIVRKSVRGTAPDLGAFEADFNPSQ